MHVKLLQKESFKKQQKQLVIWLIIKLLIKSPQKTEKNSEEDNSETVINKYDKEIPKERYLSPEQTQEIIDELRLKQ